MNRTPSTGIAREHDGEALCWPHLDSTGDGPDVSPATPLAMQVCEALERRLERLAAHPLPVQVAEDVRDMWRDLGDAQALLADGHAHERQPGRTQRLLADLQAWLPVCETWIGLGRQEPARWPVLMN
jgi:hypothetical protein